MIKNIKKTIREYIADVIHMSLATTLDNKPWVCEVHYAYDDDLNLYFISRSKSRHSTELSLNKFVAGNIVAQHNKTDKPRGVYFEGVAEALEGVDKNHLAFLTYKERFGIDEQVLNVPETAEGKKGFYKISVENFYVFDARESKPSTKYKLEWNKNNG